MNCTRLSIWLLAWLWIMVAAYTCTSSFSHFAKVLPTTWKARLQGHNDKDCYSIDPASTVVNDQASVWEPLHDIYCSLEVLAPFKPGRWCFDVVNRQPRLSIVLDHLRKPSVHYESYCTLAHTHTHTHTHTSNTPLVQRKKPLATFSINSENSIIITK